MAVRVRLREYEGRGLPPSQALPTGGYARADIPDPDDPMERYRRTFGSQPTGTYSSARLPQSNAPNPFIGALGANITLGLRGREQREQYEAGEAARRAEAGNVGVARLAPIRTVTPSLAVDALRQALYEVGTDELIADAGFGNPIYDPKTGTTTMTRQPGFFGTQAPGQERAYDPREAKAGEIPPDSPIVHGQARLQRQTEETQDRLRGITPKQSARINSQKALQALKDAYAQTGSTPHYKIF